MTLEDAPSRDTDVELPELRLSVQSPKDRTRQDNLAAARRLPGLFNERGHLRVDWVELSGKQASTLGVVKDLLGPGRFIACDKDPAALRQAQALWEATPFPIGQIVWREGDILPFLADSTDTPFRNTGVLVFDSCSRPTSVEPHLPALFRFAQRQTSRVGCPTLLVLNVCLNSVPLAEVNSYKAALEKWITKPAHGMWVTYRSHERSSNGMMLIRLAVTPSQVVAFPPILDEDSYMAVQLPESKKLSRAVLAFIGRRWMDLKRPTPPTLIARVLGVKRESLAGALAGMARGGKSLLLRVTDGYRPDQSVTSDPGYHKLVLDAFPYAIRFPRSPDAQEIVKSRQAIFRRDLAPAVANELVTSGLAVERNGLLCLAVFPFELDLTGTAPKAPVTVAPKTAPVAMAPKAAPPAPAAPKTVPPPPISLPTVPTPIHLQIWEFVKANPGSSAAVIQKAFKGKVGVSTVRGYCSLLTQRGNFSRTDESGPYRYWARSQPDLTLRLLHGRRAEETKRELASELEKARESILATVKARPGINLRTLGALLRGSVKMTLVRGQTGQLLRAGLLVGTSGSLRYRTTDPTVMPLDVLHDEVARAEWLKKAA